MKNTSHLFKALSDETRLRIIALLFKGELCVCDLMEVLQLPQSTVSRHLAYLRNAGWVLDRRQNKWMYYKLNPDNSILGQDLLKVLKKHFPKMDLIQQDQLKLEEFLATKRTGSCT